jgi:hypothetical protein
LDQALAYLKQALEIFQIIGQSGEILKMEKIIEEINSKC